MRNYFLLISESIIGIHSEIQDNSIEWEVFSTSFFPNIVIDSSEKMQFSVGKNNEALQKSLLRYVSLTREGANVHFMLGFDFDVVGESMSIAFRNELILQGVPKEKILRTPLTEQGYIAVKEFSEGEKYKKYLYLQQQFINKLKANKVHPIGFQKVISLSMLMSYKGKETLVKSGLSNTDGNSTFTVVSKFLNGEDF